MVNTVSALSPQHASLDETYPLHGIFHRREVEQQLAPMLPPSLTDIVGDYTSERNCPVSREMNHMQEHQHEMTPELVAFMRRAYSLIAKTNASHGPDAPAAVILQAVSDYYNAFTPASHLPQFALLAKTHYVILKVIGGHEKLGPTLNEIGQQLGNRPIMTLIIRAHGCATSLQFSNDNQYTIENVCPEDFACLHPKASIILNACLAGKQLAKKIALAQSRPVFANTESSDNFFLTPCCSKHGYGMVAFNDNTLITKRFQQQEERIPCIATKKNIEEIKSTLFRHTMQSAAEGNAVDQKHLGLCYMIGQGAPQSYARAAEWYRRAAEQGNAAAQHYLGVLHAYGQGAPPSYAMAVEWFKRAAAQGSEDSQHNLGVLHENGQGVPQSYARAAEWYRRAAEQECAVAQINLGLLYMNGQGVPKSYERAAEWFRCAAEQGNAAAQLELGMCYVSGQGAPRSYERAAEWFRRAAEQGLALPLEVRLYIIGARLYRTGGQVLRFLAPLLTP